MQKTKKTSKHEQTQKRHQKLPVTNIQVLKPLIHVCAYHCAQLSYTTQHATVLVIFPLSLQTFNIAQTLSIAGERKL